MKKGDILQLTRPGDGSGGSGPLELALRVLPGGAK